MKRTEIGTCSWKYPEWDIYPDNADTGLLKYYAGIYRTVEVDQWFWSLFYGSRPKLPDPSIAADYAQNAGDDFTFCIKIPNSITLTHYYKNQTSGKSEKNPWFLSHELFQAFYESISPLCLNPPRLNFQFEYLNKAKMSGISEFISRLDGFFGSIKTEADCCIEIRNQAYYQDEYFDFLNRKKLYPVLLQGYFMDDIWLTARKYYDMMPERLVIRLLGRDRDEIEKLANRKWDRIVLDKDNELETISKMIRYFEKHNKFISVYVNNHYEGSAPLTIRKLVKLLDE